MRAEIRPGLTLSPKRSRVLSPYLPQEQVDSRDEREVKPQAARRHRLVIFYDCLRQLRDSRGR